MKLMCQSLTRLVLLSKLCLLVPLTSSFGDDLSSREGWKDSSGLTWGDEVRQEDGQTVLMNYEQAREYCESIGSTLPSKLDFERLAAEIDAGRINTKGWYLTGATQQHGYWADTMTTEGYPYVLSRSLHTIHGLKSYISSTLVYNSLAIKCVWLDDSDAHEKRKEQLAMDKKQALVARMKKYEDLYMNRSVRRESEVSYPVTDDNPQSRELLFKTEHMKKGDVYKAAGIDAQTGEHIYRATRNGYRTNVLVRDRNTGKLGIGYYPTSYTVEIRIDPGSLHDGTYRAKLIDPIDRAAGGGISEWIIPEDALKP